MASVPPHYRKYLIGAAGSYIVYKAKLEKVEQLPRFPWFPSNENSPYTDDMFHELMEQFHGSHQEAVNQAFNDSMGMLEGLIDKIHTINPAMQATGQDPADIRTYQRGSVDTAYTHLYGMHTDVKVTNAEQVLTKDGMYALKDISTFWDWNGILPADDQHSKALIDEYNACTTAAEREIVLEKIRPSADKAYKQYVANNQFVNPGDHFFMGHNLVEFQAAKWYEKPGPDGKMTKGFAMLLTPGKTHAFAGWIVHGYMLQGPHSIRAYVLGGGGSYMVGNNHINSYVAPVMWAITKSINAARYDFEQRKVLGEIAKDAQWEDHFFTHHKELVEAWAKFKHVVGLGSKVAIFWNRILGRPEAEPLPDVVEVREALRNEQGFYDVESDLQYTPYGDKEFTMEVEHVDKKHVQDGFTYNGTRLDSALAFMLTAGSPSTTFYGEWTPPTITKDDKLSRILTDKILDRVADVMDMNEMRKRADATVEAFMKSHPELLEDGPGMATDEVYKRSGVTEELDKMCSNIFDEVAPQLNDELKHFVDVMKKETHTKQAIADFVSESFYRHVQAPLIYIDGRFLRPLLDFSVCKSLSTLTAYEKTQLETQLQVLENSSKNAEESLRQAVKEDLQKKTEESKRRVEKLEKEHKAMEEEITKRKEEIDRVTHENHKYEEHTKKSWEKVEHFEPKAHLHGK